MSSSSYNLIDLFPPSPSLSKDRAVRSFESRQNRSRFEVRCQRQTLYFEATAILGCRQKPQGPHVPLLSVQLPFQFHPILHLKIYVLLLISFALCDFPKSGWYGQVLSRISYILL